MAAREDRIRPCWASIWARCLFDTGRGALGVVAPLGKPPVVWAAVRRFKIAPFAFTVGGKIVGRPDRL